MRLYEVNLGLECDTTYNVVRLARRDALVHKFRIRRYLIAWRVYAVVADRYQHNRDAKQQRAT